MRSLLAVALFCIAGSLSAGERCSAVDGGTLQCGRERVKIDGITVTKGKEARERLQRRLQGGEVVIQRRGKDKYGRTLGRLFVGGQRISQADLTPGRR